MLDGDERLSGTFAALCDPTRRAILSRLATSAATVTELAEPFAMSLPAVSRHLKVLESAGLITRGRAAQWRPCRLEAGPLHGVSTWVEQYRRFWEGTLDRMEDYLRTLRDTPSPTQSSHAQRQRPTDATTDNGPDDHGR